LSFPRTGFFECRVAAVAGSPQVRRTGFVRCGQRCHGYEMIACLHPMNNSTVFLRLAALSAGLALAGSVGIAADSASVAASPAAPAPDPSNPNFPYIGKSNPQGNAVRLAKASGHISNYDESRIPPYTLPDPLVLQNGKPVKDADTWFKQRRPEILELYESQIYGRVPKSAPKVTFEIAETDPNALNGLAVYKHLVGHFGDNPDGPKMNVNLYLPAKTTGPVPVLLHLTFFGSTVSVAAVVPAPAPTPEGAAGKAGRGGARPGEAGPIADILGRGYGYAMVRYSEIQADSAGGPGVQKLALAAGQTAPAPDEWGTISAWAWGASRIMDYFETDKDVDAKHVAIIGHSRLGKTVLWIGAQDTRFAVVFSSQGGELGSALGRRDYGETIDDMAQNFAWQFAGNLQKFVGRWNDMPVDTHMLIALSAPRAVFISGGSADQWTDPKGEFLGEVAAGPVYRLLGKKDLGTADLPPLDTPLINGDLAFLYHTGGHLITPSDWKAFLDFAGRYLKPAP
jgi:hypothetical protein